MRKRRKFRGNKISDEWAFLIVLVTSLIGGFGLCYIFKALELIP